MHPNSRLEQRATLMFTAEIVYKKILRIEFPAVSSSELKEAANYCKVLANGQIMLVRIGLELTAFLASLFISNKSLARFLMNVPPFVLLNRFVLGGGALYLLDKSRLEIDQ